MLQFGVRFFPTGAMGLHYVNGALVNSGVVDATRPQIVIYEPTPGGGLRLIGTVDYLVIADGWNAKHSGPPELMGQLFHLFESPNRFGLPAFYTLHVWAWKDNLKTARSSTGTPMCRVIRLLVRNREPRLPTSSALRTKRCDHMRGLSPRAITRGLGASRFQRSGWQTVEIRGSLPADACHAHSRTPRHVSRAVDSRS